MSASCRANNKTTRVRMTDLTRQSKTDRPLERTSFFYSVRILSTFPVGSVRLAKDGPMPAPISMDLRIRIFEARRAGESTAEVAERFAVCPAFVRRLMQRYRETGSLAAKSGPRGRQPLLAGHAEQLR